MDKSLPGNGSIKKIVSLHEVNIHKYRSALLESPNIEGDIKAIFERILEESIRCRNELVSGKAEITGIHLPVSKVETAGDKKTILLGCLQDVKTVLNFYPLLLLSDITDEREQTILIDQQDSIKKLHLHIRQFHDAQ